MENKKKCKACLEEKEVCGFHKDKSGKFGVRAICKECVKKQTDLRNFKEKPVIFVKECSKCSVTFEVNMFHKDITSKDGYYPSCKICKNNYMCETKDTRAVVGKLYRDKNLDKAREASLNCYYKNKTVYLEKQKIRYQNDKEIIYEKLRIKRNTDFLYKLKHNIKGTISSTIKNFLVNGRKSKRTEEILGCTFEEFKTHIEKQFLNWMSWENYGNVCEQIDYNCSWDLDHITPISSAKTEEDIYLLNHWSNFQPLCSKVNRYDKKDNIIEVTNLEFKQKIKE